MFERNFGEKIVLVLYRKPGEEKVVCPSSVADLPHRLPAIFYRTDQDQTEAFTPPPPGPWTIGRPGSRGTIGPELEGDCLVFKRSFESRKLLFCL
jgi:hypothetical protein